MEKKGQQSVGMSFGMIFSIILIVVFLIVAFIAINGFLDLSKSASIGSFYKNLQSEVDDAWRGQSSSTTFEIDLPSGIKKICFANLSKEITESGQDYREIENYEVYEANIFLIPPEKAQGLEWNLIKHLDIEKMTDSQNPKCFDVDVDLKIKKDFYDKFVVIEWA
tara:strand:- start:923 stop:1417 length:495 start_codon:yes stop_codon:yes gene_type:complete